MASSKLQMGTVEQITTPVADDPNNGRAQVDIPERALAFAVRVLKLVRALPRDTGGQIVARQIAKSATSVGANVEEAQGSHSRAEFARRMGIARSEARETLYWLRLIAESEMVKPERLEGISQEAEELVKILTAIVKSARRQQAT